MKQGIPGMARGECDQPAVMVGNCLGQPLRVELVFCSRGTELVELSFPTLVARRVLCDELLLLGTEDSVFWPKTTPFTRRSLYVPAGSCIGEQEAWE